MAPCFFALAVSSCACVVDVELSVGWKGNAFTYIIGFKEDETVSLAAGYLLWICFKKEWFVSVRVVYVYMKESER